MEIFVWVFGFIYLEILWPFLVAVYFNQICLCECMDLYTQIHSACLRQCSLNHLVLWPQKQQGLWCFLPVWSATFPSNYTAHTVYPFCAFNDLNWMTWTEMAWPLWESRYHNNRNTYIFQQHRFLFWCSDQNQWQWNLFLGTCIPFLSSQRKWSPHKSYLSVPLQELPSAFKSKLIFVTLTYLKSSNSFVFSTEPVNYYAKSFF